MEGRRAIVIKEYVVGQVIGQYNFINIIVINNNNTEGRQ